MALDPLTARLRASAALNAVSLRPAGLPPAAILCVRRLRDPLPGALGLRHSTGVPPAWQRAASAALDEVVRRARRPAREAVPADAVAVLFDDPAELLACFALDWLAGQVTARWWWPLLFGSLDPDRPLAVWSDAPQAVPAALALLTARDQGVAFVQAVPDHDARWLTQRVLSAHGATGLLAALEEPTPEGAAIPEPDSPLHSIPRDTAGPGGLAVPPPPWSQVAPEAEAAAGTLSDVQRTFLGVSLTLHRLPPLALSQVFAEQVRTWRRRAARAEEVRGASPPLPQPPAHPAPPVEPAPFDPVSVHQPIRPEEPERSMRDPVAVERAARADLLPSTHNPHLNPSCAPAGEGAGSRDPAAVPTALAGPIPGGCSTALGGLFYLLNLGLYLDLYGDFTSPGRPGIGLSPWDFVTLVGRGLLGDGADADPVWPLLAELAGRAPDEPPGQGFAPPAEWRVPEEWLRPFGWADGAEREEREGRLRVWHPEQFLILDVPLEGEPDRPRSRDLGRDGTLSLPGVPEGIGRWLAWLLPYVRARLLRALGLAERSEVGPVLCRAKGRVFVTATRVDVALSLAELPIAVRLAGLDRDPGWIPAAGRTIAFHFEQEDLR
jgi:hypothetical protein